MSTTDEELEAQRPAEDAEESEWKKFARLWEKRAKDAPSPEEIAALKERAAKADELEAAGQTDVERLTARAEKAEAEVEDLRGKLSSIEQAETRKKLIDEVAEAKGVPASALRGETREDLEAHADELAQLIPAKPKAATDGSGGDRGDDIEGEDASAKDIADSLRI